jgi:Sulfotransferase family
MNAHRPQAPRRPRQRARFGRPPAAELRGDVSRAHLVSPHRESLFADPIFILGLPRSFSWLVCAMIGQHPQAYALPELQLFGAATMGEWWSHSSRESFPLAHGLLRAVAQLFFGGQTEQGVSAANGWLSRRSHCTTGMILEELIDRASPRVVVEKSPGVVYRQEYMRRMLAMFPTARFVHLVRHPVGHGRAVLAAIRHVSALDALPPSHWLLDLASARWPFEAEAAEMPAPPWDPQSAWYALNKGIREFLAAVPSDRRMLLRGEDLCARPVISLRRIAAWAGLRTDIEAIEAMKHPTRSPFACYGPASARYGIDLFLSSQPFGLSEAPLEARLDAPVPWTDDGRELRPEVKQLARELGYE